MAGLRETLASAVAARLAADGIESGTATYLANAVAARATFDALGTAVGLAGIVDTVKAENADLTTAFAPASTKQAETPRSSLDREMQTAREAAEADRDARVQAVRSDGNPWAAGTRNVTRQCILSSIDPALADRLQREAGA